MASVNAAMAAYGSRGTAPMAADNLRSMRSISSDTFTGTSDIMDHAGTTTV
jgi:hypothetical protein